VLEVREDGFYYDAQGVHNKIVPNIGNPNHPFLYHEFATIAEDHGHVVDKVQIACNHTTMTYLAPPQAPLEP
jgi:hypothetical protein